MHEFHGKVLDFLNFFYFLIKLIILALSKSFWNNFILAEGKFTAGRKISWFFERCLNTHTEDASEFKQFSDYYPDAISRQNGVGVPGKEKIQNVLKRHRIKAQLIPICMTLWKIGLLGNLLIF